MTIEAQLSSIGFTEYEAKVYLQLLKNYPANGYQLSKDSGVPRSMVYEALGRLSQRGAVLETTVDRSTLYRPLPPTQLLEQYELQQKRVFEELNASLNQVYSTRSEDYLWSMNGWNSIVNYARSMIRDAQTSIDLVLNDDGVRDLRTDIERAALRGVETSVLLTGTEHLDVGRVAYHPPSESEAQRMKDLCLVLKDESEALIATLAVQASATVTKNPHLVLICGQFVWMELLTQRIAERLTDDVWNRLDEADRAILGHARSSM